MYGYPSHPLPGRLAVAVLALDLASTGAVVQLTPDGVFRARDGRPRNLPGWRIDAAIAERVLAKLKARKTPIVIDYEHQTLHAENNGQPAPAAGWIDPQSMNYQPGTGLTGTVEWTPRARGMIDAGEYKFLSPVLPYDTTTGEVLDLIQVALTNYPGVDGMAAVAQLSGRFDLDPPKPEEETPVDRTALIALLGLKAEATDVEINNAITALKATAADATVKDQEIAALKAQSPDPAKYVPVETFESLKTEVATLKGAQVASEVDTLVTAGLAAGKLLPAQESWARELGAKDVAALTSYLAQTPAIAALKGTQTNGKKPEGTDDGEPLDETALAVCKQMGVNPDDYRKTLAAAA